MITSKTQFQQFLEEEVRKVEGIAVPVRAGVLRRALIRKMNCKKLHPNPDDEFCSLEIGPKYEIISRYEHDFRKIRDNPQTAMYMNTGAKDPLDIERIRPDGYMIMNGHHRWAAAIRVGMKTVPVRIVDLTQEKDILKMLDKSRHEKRVTLDLDEVVFRKEEDGQVEKPLSFPFSRIYKERLRLGIPALFRFFRMRGYDVWVYSAGYYSVDYIRALFRLYGMRPAGIVTGTARKSAKAENTREMIENRMAEKYTETIHIDNETLLRIDSRTKEFEEFTLSRPAEGWSKEIMDMIGEMEKHA